MKKLIICTILASAIAAFGGHRPHGPGFGGPHGPRVHYAPSKHHHHNAGPFWTGVGVGLVSLLIAPAVLLPPPPPTARVWIPARTETRYDAYGRPYIVTIPGYWQY